MRRHVKVFLFVFISFLFSSGAVSPALAGDVFKATLGNGLNVIIEEEHSAPVVAVQMWVRVGGADESDKDGGISHVFEHMLFKGTAKRKVGEIAKEIEAVGGDINAYTSYDNTVYHLVVPSRNFPTGLDIISDAIQRSSFDPEELKKELQVVLEEIRMNEDSPSRSLYKNLLSTAFTAHPYGRPVIGYKDVVEKFTREQIVEFFKRWYIPNNMTLVIVGDVGRDAALKAVREEFKDFKKRPDPHRKRAVEPVQERFRTKIAAQPIKETHLGLGFHIPRLRDNATYAIDVLSAILGGGESSRLYKRLKADEGIVHSISSYPMSLEDSGVFLVTGTLESKNVDRAVYESLQEITRLAVDGPTYEEIERAKLNLRSEFIYQRETMNGIAGKLGYYETHFGDYRYEKKYIEGVARVTAEDIKHAAMKYLNVNNMSVIAVVPDGEKSQVTDAKLSAAVKKASAEAQKTLAGARERSERVKKVRLDNGITLIVKEVHSNPTVSFYAAFPGGLRFENAGTNGLSGFMASMLTRGTQKRSREDIARDVEDIAGSISGFSGWNTVGVSGTFLSDFFDRGLDIFADVMLNPSFPDGEVEKLRKETVAAINRQEDYLPAYTFKLLYRDLYKEHPYGMPSIGTVETVNAFTRDDVVRQYQELFAPERMVLAIVGDVDADQAIERVTALFKGLKRPPSKLPSPPAEKRQTSIRSTGAVKDKAQTNIGIGFLGTTIGSDDRYALKVLSEVLSGQSGRLFLDLRDRQSLAYALSAFSKEAADPGVFAVYIACAPEKKDAAIEGILKELKTISTEKVSAEELKKAKSSIIGGYEIGLQEVSSQAADMANNELFGFGYDFSKTYPKKIADVSASDVLHAARKYITLNAYTISVVGPAAKTDAREMKEGKETEEQKGDRDPRGVKTDRDGAEKK